jgi:hypothetical protein
MTTYLIVGLASGIIFVLLDFVLNGNPLARRLSEPYAPIARKGIRLIAPVVIDLLYGLAMAGIFLLLRPALPGGRVVGAGISFGLIAWFFRVLMSAISQWVMFDLPLTTHFYSIAAGLLEMMALGLFYGVAFKSFP